MNNLKKSCCEDISFIPDIEKELPKGNEIDILTNIFKALSNPIRIKILFALIKYEICVGEMANLLQLPQDQISNQLRVLRKSGLVDYYKDKKMSFYYIKDEYIRELLKLTINESKG